MKSKSQLRREILDLLANQSPQERTNKTRVIKDKLFSLKEFKFSKNILIYLSLDTEVATREIIIDAVKLKKRIFAPVIDGRRLGVSEVRDLDRDTEIGPLGVFQPKKGVTGGIPEEGLDLVIVPGLAFDSTGNRLGRGKGYFDRFLKGLPKTVKRVGLAFDIQILKLIPKDPHDIPVDKVITN